MSQRKPSKLKLSLEDKIQIINEKNVMDDLFMRENFKNKEACQYLIRVILNKPDLEIKDHTVQADLSNPTGRGVILEILARDTEGNYNNIEIQ